MESTEDQRQQSYEKFDVDAHGTHHESIAAAIVPRAFHDRVLFWRGAHKSRRV